MSMKYIEEKSRSGVIHKKYTSEFGKKILEKYGWKEGEGLGKNKTGITDVVQVKRREENKGLGKEEKTEKWNDKWWENSYDNILKNIVPKNEKVKKEESENISSDETEPEQKKANKEKKSKKSKKDKIEKEITYLNKKRKITFITL